MPYFSQQGTSQSTWAKPNKVVNISRSNHRYQLSAVAKKFRWILVLCCAVSLCQLMLADHYLLVPTSLEEATTFTVMDWDFPSDPRISQTRRSCSRHTPTTASSLTSFAPRRTSSTRTTRTTTTCTTKDLYFSDEHMYTTYSKKGAPILGSATLQTITNETILLFQAPKNLSFFEMIPINNGRWWCNNKKARAITMRDVKEFIQRPDLGIIIVICPPLLSLEEGSLNTVTFQKRWETIRYENLSKWWHCQINEHPVTKYLSKASTGGPNVDKSTTSTGVRILSNVVASTMVRGPIPQAYLPQWMEYHRKVFGIGHFFVYVNEDWSIFRGRSTYQEWDFCTYVPFPMGGLINHKYFGPFYFQRMQQNDFLYRVKAFQLPPGCDPNSSPPVPQTIGAQSEWILMMDIDEYLFAPKATPSKASPSLYLESLLAKYSAASGSKVSGLLFENHFLSGPGAESFELLDRSSAVDGGGRARSLLLCDWTWFMPIVPSITGWNKEKFLARSDLAVYFNVHFALSVSSNNRRFSLLPGRTLSIENMHRIDPGTELRHNHFKILFNKTKQEYEDTAMKDQYCQMMREIMKS